MLALRSDPGYHLVLKRGRELAELEAQDVTQHLVADAGGLLDFNEVDRKSEVIRLYHLTQPHFRFHVHGGREDLLGDVSGVDQSLDGFTNIFIFRPASQMELMIFALLIG